MTDELPESLAPALEIIATRALGKAEDARDAVQETLARALEALREGRIPASVPVATFVYGIARHVIADCLRLRVRQRTHDGEPELLAHTAASALELLVLQEDRERMQQALARLPASDRELLRRCFIEGERVVDIAVALGEPPERVRKRKSRALAQVRELLGAPAPRHIPAPDPTIVT